MSESAQITAVLIGLAILTPLLVALRHLGRTRYPTTDAYAGFRTDAHPGTGELLLLDCEGHCDGDTAHETDSDGTATCVLCATTRRIPAPDAA